MNPNIAVIYIARGDGTDRFARSYQNCDAGIEHDLIFAFKGISGSPSIWNFQHQPRLCIGVADFDYDLGAYRQVAAKLKHEYIVCLNSSSEILAANWLKMMYEAIQTVGVGLVGCTASAESMATNASNRIGRWLRYLFFPYFPNYHIRTNAFMIKRELFLKLCPRRFYSKRHCYLFEAGWFNLTRKVQDLGLKTGVVNRHGDLHTLSIAGKRIYRDGEQQDLLIADCQTRQYQNAGPLEREELATKAWG